MASKTLIRSGASLMNRLLSKPFVQQNPNSTSPFVPHGLELTQKLFPSLSNLQTSLHLQQNDAQPLTKLASQGFLYPSGLPSLPFFLPDGNLSLSLSLFCHFLLPVWIPVKYREIMFSALIGCLEIRKNN